MRAKLRTIKIKKTKIAVVVVKYCKKISYKIKAPTFVDLPFNTKILIKSLYLRLNIFRYEKNLIFISSTFI